MGTKDVTEKILEDYNDVFADMKIRQRSINLCLFAR